LRPRGPEGADTAAVFLAVSFVCKLLPRCLSTSVLPLSLLCSCHLLLCSLN
jgi:hypothetical protein